ncbi:helix-turn-helix transcriptional regulator [Bacteroides sp. AM10-21B]|uniref:helix-turn-helix transcriptional regulator n=1 Tax=Bacteroides sp. AM10-21B TaxID=2292001 RepID=UPI001F3B7BF8|nr:helix-turn-helix domain-containing protein [Bacteroides sp. AM10-21B]
MRKIDFKQKLVNPNYRVDNNMIRRYIREIFVSKEMTEQEIADVEQVIEARYERHGILTMEDNIQCLRTGNGFELIEGGKQSLAYIREEINKYRQNFADDLTFWSEVEKDWNNLPCLLGDLNEIENYNLNIYLGELRLWSEKCPDTPKKKKELGTMDNKEEVLKNICDLLKGHMHVSETPPSDIIGIDEVCEMTGLSKYTVYKKTSNKEIPFYKSTLSKRSALRFLRPEIRTWMLRHRIGTVDEFLEQQDGVYNNK